MRESNSKTLTERGFKNKTSQRDCVEKKESICHLFQGSNKNKTLYHLLRVDKGVGI